MSALGGIGDGESASSSSASGLHIIEKPWGRIVIYPDGTQQRIVKDRHLFVLDEDYSIEPDSLVGSSFHVLVGGRIIWQGVVVGEPQAGRYLVHIDELDRGVVMVQRLFSLDTLMGVGEEARRLIEGAISESKAEIIDPYIEWRFYDSPARARLAFLHLSGESESNDQRLEAPEQPKPKPRARRKTKGA